jgi:hypothetical protein
MDAAKRVQIARWANARQQSEQSEPYSDNSYMEKNFGSSDWKTVGSLALWAVGRHLGNLSDKSDKELTEMIALQFGFASDENIDPSRVIKSPDRLVVGNEYRLASNGYPLGKYMGSQMSPSHPGGHCGCDGTQRVWSFESGWRGPVLWEIGIY